MNFFSLSHLSDAALQHGLASHVSTHRASLAWLLAHLAEFDERGLFAPAAHPSMHSYCVGALGMSEDEASRRITAARMARQFPAIFAMVADGRLHLTAIVLLAPRLKASPERADELLAVAAHKSRNELERLIAERFPQPELPARVTAEAPVLSPCSDDESSAPARMPFCDFVKPESRPARVAPLSGTTYGIQYTFDQADYDLLQYAQALMSHRVPSGNVREISRLALVALVEKTEKQLFGVGRRRRRGQRPASDPRHIARAVKRAVWQRDGGRCTFVGETGERCPARQRLHFDHVDPVGRGGDASVSNLRLLCQAHNHYEADRVYGAAFMNGKREAARAARAQFAEVAAKEAAPEPETTEPDAEVLEDAAAALRSLGYRDRDAREAVRRCGLPPGATLEQHVRAALAMRVRPLLAQSARIQAAQMRAPGVSAPPPPPR